MQLATVECTSTIMQHLYQEEPPLLCNCSLCRCKLFSQCVLEESLTSEIIWMAKRSHVRNLEGSPSRITGRPTNSTKTPFDIPRTNFTPGSDDSIAVPAHRRLFFHGDKSHLIVDTSMAFNWIMKWKEILDMREHVLDVAPSQWMLLSPSEKFASILTNELLATYDNLFKPYGYSVSNPEQLTTMTLFANAQ